MGTNSNSLYYRLLRIGIHSGVSTIDNTGHFEYTHNVSKSASQYLTVLNFINNSNKSSDLFKKMIIIFEKIVNNSYENEDALIAGRFINSYPLNELMLLIFPKIVNEIDNIINGMTADELKEFINNFKMEYSSDENTNILIAYLNYLLDEKIAYEECMRFVRSPEEKAASRYDHEVNISLNNAARFHAFKSASKVRM